MVLNHLLIAQTFLSGDPFQDHFFIENKGQFNRLLDKDVLYELSDGSDKIYILSNGFLWMKFLGVAKNGDSSYKISTIQNRFLGCNKNAEIHAQGKTKHHFTYGNSSSRANGYKKLEFLNFYPKIDLIYEFGKLGEGLKYSFRINSGGDPRVIKFNYLSDNLKSTIFQNQTLHVSNSDYGLKEFGLTVLNQNGYRLPIFYEFKDGNFTYQIPDFKMGDGILIDPWVKSVDSLTRTNINSERYGENIGFDVDYDSKGSVFVYGGCPLDGNQSKLAKYDASGNLVWVFQGMVNLPKQGIYWYSNPLGGSSRLGSFVIDRSNDKVYLSDAWGMPKVGNLIIRLDSNGNSDSFLIHHPGLTTANKFLFRCDPHRVITLGGFNHYNYWSNLFELLDTNIYKPKAFTPKKLSQYEMIIDAATDDSNIVYVLLKAFSPPYSVTNNSNNVDVLAKLTDSLTGTLWYDTLLTKIDQWTIKPLVPRYLNQKISIGYSTNSIAATKNYIYYYDGKFIAAYNKFSGALVKLDSLVGKSQSFQQGIVADNCGNIVVGSDSGRLKVFKFDGSNFKWIKNVSVYPNSDRCVLDLSWDKDRNVLVFSGDSMVGVVSNPVNCEASKTTEFSVYPVNRCSYFAYADIKYPDTTKAYTFSWFDSTENKVVRKVTKFKQFKDTLEKRDPTHSYLVSIKQEDACYSLVSNFWLRAFPQFDTLLEIKLCFGEFYTHDNSNLTNDTQFVDTFKTLLGCDSLIRYSLAFYNHSNLKQKKTICMGDTFWVGPLFYTKSGNYSDTLINSVGCDSVVTTELRVIQDTSIQFIQICDGSSINIGTHIYTISGLYTDTFMNYLGCDSIVRTKLIVSRDTLIERFSVICRGDSVKVGINKYDNEGIYIDSFKRESGCDSVIKTYLTVNRDTMITTIARICKGETWRVGNNVYTKPGAYVDTLHRLTGCDSVIITELNILNTNDTTKQIVLCSGDSVWIDGEVYNFSTSFDKVYQNSNGCDSTVTYRIQKREVFADFEIDSSQNPVFEFKNLSNNNWKFYWSFGDLTTDSVNRTVTHTYKNDETYWVNSCLTVLDSFGCRDSVCYQIQISKLLYRLFNIFTPGKDGTNDVLKIGYKGGAFQYNLMIFNRWGAKVYEVKNANVEDESKFWNGKVNNTDLECPSGSYYVLYQLYLEGPNKPPTAVNGIVTLIRELE